MGQSDHALGVREGIQHSRGWISEISLLAELLPSGSSEGESIQWLFPKFCYLRQSLVFFSGSCISSVSASVFTGPFVNLCVSDPSFIRTPTIGFKTHPRSRMIHPEKPNLITSPKTLFPNKVTFTGPGDQDLDISFGGQSSTHYTSASFSHWRCNEGPCFLTQESQLSPYYGLYSQPFTLIQSRHGQDSSLDPTFSLAAVWPWWTCEFPLHCRRGLEMALGCWSPCWLELLFMLEALRSDHVDSSSLLRSGPAWMDLLLTGC